MNKISLTHAISATTAEANSRYFIWFRLVGHHTVIICLIILIVSKHLQTISSLENKRTINDPKLKLIYIYTYWIQNPKFCGLKTNYRVFLRNSKKTWLFLKNLVISHILVLWWFMMIYDSFSIFQQHHVWFHWGFVVLYEVDSASICAPSDERKHLINGNQNHKQILFDMTPR